MPPRDPKPANSRRKSKIKLDMPEPELAGMLEQYCDLRQRGFDQQAIQTRANWTRANWTRHLQNLLLEEAQRREIPGSQGSQELAVTEWLLAMYDVGAELRVIQRMSAFSDLQTKKRLETALDNASGPAPTDLIITDTHGEPARVSWLAANGTLMHRPFDGAFLADYPAELAIRQCTEVLYRLLGYPNSSSRDRAYNMLSIAEAGLHSFGYDEGREVNAALEKAVMDEDTKRTVILNLHHDPALGKLLLQRCGIKERWLAGNAARSLSRLIRRYEYSPTLVRTVLEYLGNDPNPYYMIGPDYRIPELTREDMVRCTQAMREFGFSEERIRVAMATVGVPPSGHHPPKRSRKKQP